MGRFTKESKRTDRVMQYERTARFEVDYRDGAGFQQVETARALLKLADAYKDLLLLLDNWPVGEPRRTTFATYKRLA